MTSKAEALDRLIDAVEAGNEVSLLNCLKSMSRDARDKGEFWPSLDIGKAHHGSLDAAKALHEALLPGWEYAIYSPCPSFKLYQVQLETEAMRIDINFEPVSGEAKNPARAWLLAILSAYRAQSGGAQ